VEEISNSMMTPKQVRQFIAFFRDYFRLKAEVLSLSAILETAEQQDQPPVKWREALRLLRDKEEYRNTSQQYEHIFVQFEQKADEVEIANFLDTIPPTEFPN
jgi:hypothetical protein